MTRRSLIGLGLVLVAAAAARAQGPPEKMLSPTTQLYVKWDGVAAHAEAYKNSALGSILAGPTGDSIRTLIAKGYRGVGANVLSEPLLAGKAPAELKAVHTDLKNAEKLLDLVLDKGLVVAAEVKGPSVTLGGLGKALGGLLDGRPNSINLVPDARLFLIVPDVGERADALFSTIRLLSNSNGAGIAPLPAKFKRRGFAASSDAPQNGSAAWWLEGKHFVFYVGTAKIETVIQGFAENAAKGGILNHPLYRRTLKTGDFESVARGFVDTAAVIQLAVRLAGPLVPDLARKLQAIGVSNLQSVVFSSGFKGKESRALYEIDLPGERRGLAKILKAKPIALADLPPLPPDVSRFSLLRIDPSGAYDAGLVGIDMLAAGDSLGIDSAKKSPEEIARLRKAYLERELTKFLGVNVRDDLLPHLGDKALLYQTPTEGFSVFGTVLCMTVKNKEKVQVAMGRIERSLGSVANVPLKLRRKVLAGVEIREHHLGVIAPTYAIVGDWLVMALHPQAVQGMVLRHAGQLERWQPNAATARRLATMPADAIGLQYCNPKSTVQNLSCIGPLAIGTIGSIRFSSRESENQDPPDIGLVPNGHELSRHLFPNLTYTRDDGKTVRIEVNESFSLPLEFVGFEPFAVGLSGIFGIGF